MERFICNKNTEQLMLRKILGKICEVENQYYINDMRVIRLSFDLFDFNLDEQTGDCVMGITRYVPGYDMKIYDKNKITLNIRNPYKMEVKTELYFYANATKFDKIYWDIMYLFFGEKYKAALLNYLEENKSKIGDYEIKLEFAQKLGETNNVNI